MTDCERMRNYTHEHTHTKTSKKTHSEIIWNNGQHFRKSMAIWFPFAFVWLRLWYEWEQSTGSLIRIQMLRMNTNFIMKQFKFPNTIVTHIYCDIFQSSALFHAACSFVRPLCCRHGKSRLSIRICTSVCKATCVHYHHSTCWAKLKSLFLRTRTLQWNVKQAAPIPAGQPTKLTAVI